MKYLWIVLAVTVGLLVSGCRYEPPVQPVEVIVVNPRHGFAAHMAGDPGYSVTVQTPDGIWRGSRVIESGLRLKSTPGVFFMRFTRNNEDSPLFGYSWPDIPTCWQPPGRMVSEGAWRVTYCYESPDEYPACERQEMGADGWNVICLDDRFRQFWFRVEQWDVNSSAYISASSWFEVDIVSQAEVDDPDFERPADGEMYLGPYSGAPPTS